MKRDEMKKSKFVVAVVETLRREVVVEAADAFEAEEIVENECNSGGIDLDAFDFESRDVHWIPGRKVK